MNRIIAMILAAGMTTILSAAESAGTASDSVRTANILNEIVVTGSNSAVRTNLLPYTVSVLGPAQLEASGQTEVLNIISGRVPSVFVTQRGILGFGVSNGGSGHIKVRGVGGDRASAVLMMVDGQPQFAGLYSHHVADMYTKEYVERVEVLRGPASVLYGSNAMAGVINVITREGRRDGFHASLSSQYGSYNTWQSSLTATAVYGKWKALASASYDRTDGNIKGMDFKNVSGYFKTGYELSRRWNVAADVTIDKFVADDPVYATLDNPESTDVYHQNVTRGETSLAFFNRYAGTDGAVRAYYSWGNHYIDDPRHFHSLDDRAGVMLYQNITPWAGASLTAGFDFDTYSGKIPMSGGNAHKPGAMATTSRRRITEYSPYLTFAQSLADGFITLNGGLRMANSNMFATRWIPQAGFALNPGAGVTLKASVAMGYRNPSFRELYLYRMANPDLQPERMWNYEVTAGKDFGSMFHAEVTAYYSRGSNMIQVVDMKNMNTGRFINKGIELSARAYVSRTLTLSASYSYLHTSLVNLTGAPRHQYFAGVGWQPLPRLAISAQLKGVARLWVHQSIDTQSYAVADLKATYGILPWLDLTLRLDNITDARYVINRGYEMPGFTAMGGIRLHL